MDHSRLCPREQYDRRGDCEVYQEADERHSDVLLSALFFLPITKIIFALLLIFSGSSIGVISFGSGCGRRCCLHVSWWRRWILMLAVIKGWHRNDFVRVSLLLRKHNFFLFHSLFASIVIFHGEKMLLNLRELVIINLLLHENSTRSSFCLW